MMRSCTVICIALAGTLTVAHGGFAQERGAPQEGRGFGPGPSAMFMMLDTDRNGSLSAAEIAGAPASLTTLDRNGDGRVTADELPRMGRGGREGFPGFGRGGREGRGDRGDGPGETRPTSADDLVSVLMGFDANKDGTLTKAEVPERFQGLFTRADTDKDGQLTAGELTRSAAAQAQPADSGERGRGERDGDRGERGRGDGPPMARRDALLAPLDANRDGALSAEEIAGSPAALRKLDRNGDGLVTPDELPSMDAGRG